MRRSIKLAAPRQANRYIQDRSAFLASAVACTRSLLVRNRTITDPDNRGWYAGFACFLEGGLLLALQRT